MCSEKLIFLISPIINTIYLTQLNPHHRRTYPFSFAPGTAGRFRKPGPFLELKAAVIALRREYLYSVMGGNRPFNMF